MYLFIELFIYACIYFFISTHVNFGHVSPEKDRPLIQLTIRKLALFEDLAETLAEFQVALVLGAFDKLFKLIRAGLLLLGGLLLVHGLSLVWLSLVRLALVRLLKNKTKNNILEFSKEQRRSAC